MFAARMLSLMINTIEGREKEKKDEEEAVIGLFTDINETLIGGKISIWLNCSL